MHDPVTWYKITHAGEGLPKHCNLYQSTWTCLCFGSPTAQLAHQHVWFCTMWSDRAKGLLKKCLQVNCVKHLNHIVVLGSSPSRLGNVWPRGTKYETDLLLHQEIVEYFVSKTSITLSMKSEMEHFNKTKIKIKCYTRIIIITTHRNLVASHPRCITL